MVELQATQVAVEKEVNPYLISIPSPGTQTLQSPIGDSTLPAHRVSVCVLVCVLACPSVHVCAHYEEKE
jgi:hypothetical protein